MKLFLITPKAGYSLLSGYNEAIVCAEDKEEARAIHPASTYYGSFTKGTNQQAWDRGIYLKEWPIKPSHVAVRYIGEAHRVAKGVVLTYFEQ